MCLRLLLALATSIPAAAQPMTDPRIFGKRGFGLGGIVVGAVVGGLAFAAFKHAGEEARFRTGKPGVEKALIAGGAVVGLAIFGLCAFVL